ncbi:hypothetical protein J2W22_003068 [Sphingomonas kyeonggiensis]|uniref:hypothetical protein n=1 Tax=Sphingomonas kyeonggiensis TaxID=1268553 RepID=UPI0027802EA6|nr:hypothetical protein [Sphingomonas kyeonggiensis]MDQ0251004.1 hypothetical protein [Sphingomonas kyeonggiensis]
MTDADTSPASASLIELFNRGDPAREILLRAAVLERCDPEKLADSWIGSHPDADDDAIQLAVDAASELERETSPAIDHDGREARKLKSGTRLDLLRIAGLAFVRSLIAAQPKPTLTESLFKRLLNSLPTADLSTPQELLALKTALHWALAAGANPPISPEEVERKERLASFEAYLAGPDLEHFVGRSRMMRTLETLWDLPEDRRPAVLVRGAGGIGKSFAIAKFLIDRLHDEDPTRRPLAILHFDFDRFDLQDARVATLQADALRQFAKWWRPDQASRLLDLARGGALEGLESLSVASRSQEAARDELAVTRDALSLIRLGDERPLIAVFGDTFEKVDSYNHHAAKSVPEFCKLLRRAGADVFEIYASRSFTRPGEFADRHPPAQVQLGRFGQREAIQYLKQAAEEHGIELDDESAHQAQLSLHRMPLRLRLAVALMGEDPNAFDVRAWLRQCRSEELGSDAILYERVLKRLRGGMRELALPGLLLRRLSANIIVEVLATPCGLNIGLADAERLMEEARRDQSQLFFRNEDDPNALWHLDYVRSEMLDDLSKKVSPDMFRSIHERAVQYYAAKENSPLYRGEELYSRLQLKQSPELLDARWTPAAGRRLRGAIDELPPESARYVRTRNAGGAATPERETRYEELRIEARRRLQSGNSFLDDLLAQGSQDMRSVLSPLGDIYVQSLIARGRIEEAIKCGVDLRQRKSKVSSRVRLGVYSTVAGLLEAQRSFYEATEFWALAETAADAAPLIDRIAPAIGILRSRRRRESKPVTGSVTRALELVSETGSILYERPVTAREAVAELSERMFERPEESSCIFLLQLASYLFESGQFFLIGLDGQARHRNALAGYLSGGSGRDVGAQALNADCSKALYMRDSELNELLVTTMRAEVDASLALDLAQARDQS